MQFVACLSVQSTSSQGACANNILHDDLSCVFFSLIHWKKSKKVICRQASKRLVYISIKLETTIYSLILDER